MNCPACRHENAPGAKFCSECGARLSACPACGASVAPGAKFCLSCGGRLTGTPAPASPVATRTVPPAPAPPARFASPQSYTPKHLAEKILTSKAAVEGERKQVTVLFTDVSGFTAMSEKLDPEEVHDIMDQAFEVILEAVHRQEGTINQFLGDGVMALFGAPIAHEDHAQRGARAALAIQDGLQSVREEVFRAHGLEFRVRIGINTGTVVVGAIGRDLRMDYTAVGDTVNLAARLLNVAQPGQIVIGPRTHRLTDGYFILEELGEFTVKGKSEPVPAWAVTADIHGRTRLEVSVERGLTPLAGRDEQLARLLDAYLRAREGQGAIVVVRGEPGVGKSRLLYEFLTGVDLRGREIAAACLAHGASIAYFPLVQLVKRALSIPDGLPDDDVRVSVRDRVRAVGLDGDDAPTLVAHFLGVSASPEFLLRLGGAQLKARTFEVLRRTLLRGVTALPHVIVVEDLHWVDPSSEEFLASLAGEVAAEPVLLLFSTRATTPSLWMPAGVTTTVALAGLSADEVRGMVRTLLGVADAAPELLDVLVTKSEGNPLYVEEIVRQLQEAHDILIEDGTARLRQSNLAVPATVHDIIAARVDRLPEAIKQTMQVAAVSGRTFKLPLLAEVLAQPAPAIAEHLAELYQHDFIFPADESHVTWVFKHAVTQEVVYGSLLERRRRGYHGAVGEGLERLHAGQLDEVLEFLAHHFGRSADDDKAVDYAILAADKAQRRWANTEALVLFESALARLARMPDAEANRLRRIDAVVKQSEIKFALGRHAEQVRALEDIRELTAGADLQRRAVWLSWAGFLHSLTGASPEVPIAYCSEAAALAHSAGLDDMRAFAESCLAQVYAIAGRLREAVETGERALAFFENQGNIWWACRTLWVLSIACNSVGLWERSLEYCRRALEHGQELDDLRLKVVGLWRTGSTHIQRGDAEIGVGWCDQALALSPTPFDAAMARGMRGWGLVKAGKTQEGIARLEEVVAWLEQSNLHYTRAVYAFDLADCFLRCDERRRARALVEPGLEFSRDLGYRHLEAWGERLLGEALSVDDPDAATAHLERAAQLLEEIGARNELAKAWVGLAALRVARGQRDGVRDLVSRAMAIFSELGTIDGPDRASEVLAALEPR